ncbi:hypothetical protein KJ865_16360, partial [Myxococcota bacterium]|nr:hypothetical protein [Myxococcota bacterium]
GAPPDRRADIFSLGVMLYELTVGKRLFKGNRNEVKDLIKNKPFPTPTSIKPNMDPALEQIILRSLERDPDLRYPSAKAMVEEIELFALNRKLSLSRSSLSTYVRNTFATEPHLTFAPEDSLEREEIPINLDVKFLEEWNDEGALGAEIPEYDLSDLDDESYFELMADPEKFSEYLRQREDGSPEFEEDPCPEPEPGSSKTPPVEKKSPATGEKKKKSKAPEESKTITPVKKSPGVAAQKAPQPARPIGAVLLIIMFLISIAAGVAIGYFLR